MNGFEETLIAIFGLGLLGGLWIEAFYVNTIKKYLDLMHLHVLSVQHSRTIDRIAEKEQNK